MEPRIKEGTLVVVLDFPTEEFYWDPPGDLIGIIQERLGDDEWLVNGGSYGSRLGVREENLIPLAEIILPDQDLTPEEALRKYLPEVITTLARKAFGIPPAA